MQLKFKKQDFQDRAVEAVCDLFDGQVSAPSSFSVEKIDLAEMASAEQLLGYGNAMRLTLEQIQDNLHRVQDRNGLPQTDLTELRFNIEMETGTGKTFVYTKTIYELNDRYGFNKFVILVPSRAIKEGANASLRITGSYFQEQYSGRKLEFFIYDSKKLNQVRNFALSPNLCVMIATIDAINKDTNLFVRETEKMDKPARDYIADCKPIIILDEAHNFDTDKARKAITMLSPLFEIRYSATHKQKINTVYRLTPVDAYQEGIVKQICVANDHIEDDYNKAYIRLLEVGNDGRFFAKLELDVMQSGSVVRKPVKVYTGSNLKTVTKNDKYDGYIISGINLEYYEIEFTNTEVLSKGMAIGAYDEMAQKRNQIRRTIEAHLEKEKRLIPKGIKVLSLFFIDEVAKFRDYSSPDLKGIYAKMFEEEYLSLIEQSKFAVLKERFRADLSAYYDGYFSQDKKKKDHWGDTQGDSEADDTTYKLIMQHKEKLLSFDSDLRFIWSHSALKEGWDNPNVFQICTLIENKTVFTCRQKIGRGLRLCVNQDGERIEDRSVNVLTIVAKESFAEFAATLQKEIEQETGVEFGVLVEEMFVGIAFSGDGQSCERFTAETSRELLQHFRNKGYVDSKGAIKDTLKNDLRAGTLDLPARFENARARLIRLLKDADRKVEVRQTRERVAVKRKDELFLDDGFIEIWERIKQKSYYRINTRIDELMHRIIADIKQMPAVEKLAIIKETAKITIDQKGVSALKTSEEMASEFSVSLLPDIVRILAESTGMPRANIGKILTESARLKCFINNPQKYIEQVLSIIDYHQRTMSIEGIVYTKINNQEYSLIEVFGDADENEIMAYLSNTVAVEKSLYSRIIYESDIESTFATDLENDPNVKFFFKIPKTFKIDTPVGPYIPDWAVFYEIGDEVKMYFIVETKGSTSRLDLRVTEDIKIHCGSKHFEGIGSNIKWQLAKAWHNVIKR